MRASVLKGLSMFADGIDLGVCVTSAQEPLESIPFIVPFYVQFHGIP